MFESRLLTKRKIDFDALLKILAYGVGYHEGFWQIGGVEVVFELYRWMTSSVTGKHFERWSWETRWTRQSLAKNMSSRVGCGSDGNITPFRSSYDRHQDARQPQGWRLEIASRFAHALLDDGKMADWRSAMKIDMANPRIVPMLTYDMVPPPPRSELRMSNGELLGWRSPSCFASEVDRLFGLATPSRRLREQLNPHHPDARYVKAVLLWPTQSGWVANIEYGFEGSAWNNDCRLSSTDRYDHTKDMTWCRQGKGEPFSQFVYRAHDQFDALLTPICCGLTSCSVGDGFTGRPKHQPKWARSWDGDRCEVEP